MAHTEEMLIHGIMTPVTVVDSSAQEIDDTVAKMPPGGAAPAGFGLGTAAASVTADTILANISQNGWFLWGNWLTDPNKPFASGLLLNNVRSEGYGCQIAFDTPSQSVKMRNIINGAVGEWEWVNPPMALGVEYRTTERYLGKPVYAKLVSFGALPNSSRKSVEHGIAGIDHVCGVYAEAKYPNDTSLSMIGWGDITVCFATNTSITVTTTADRSGYNGYFTLKYTKTTD